MDFQLQFWVQIWQTRLGGIWGSVGHNGKKLNAGCGMRWKDPQVDGVVAGRQRELLVQVGS